MLNLLTFMLCLCAYIWGTHHPLSDVIKWLLQDSCQVEGAKMEKRVCYCRLMMGYTLDWRDLWDSVTTAWGRGLME